jgi:hypothetical protein
VAGALRGLETYVSGQSGLIIDCATARRTTSRNRPATTDSTVQRLLHWRMSANHRPRRQGFVAGSRAFRAPLQRDRLMGGGQGAETMQFITERMELEAA